MYRAREGEVKGGSGGVEKGLCLLDCVTAKVDLWITSHNGGELHHWMDATHVGFKRMKRARLDEETARDC